MMPPVILNQSPQFWPLKSPFCPKMVHFWTSGKTYHVGTQMIQKNMAIAKKYDATCYS